MHKTWLVAVALLGGCLQPADPPGYSFPPESGDACGDGVCSLGENGFSCPHDCAYQGPSGPPAPPACPDVQDLGQPLPLDRTFDFGAGETQQLEWHSVHSGRYNVTVSDGAQLTVHLGECTGLVVTATNLAVFAGQSLTLDVTGAGSVELKIDKLPDVCGDDVCEAGELCDVCDADCGACPPPDVCGDGFCGISESSGSCSIDCGSDDGGGSTSGGDDGSTSSGDDSGSTTTGDDGSSDDGGWGDDGGGDDDGGWGDDGGDDDDGGWGDDSGDDSDDGDDGDWGDDWFYKNHAHKPDTRLSTHPAKVTK